MISLFSSFDIYYWKFSYMVYAIFFSTLFSFVWAKRTKFYFLDLILNFVENFVSNIKVKSVSKFFFVLPLSLFFIIFISNFVSVLSFNFPTTSQLGVIFFTRSTIWLRFIAFRVRTNLKGFMRHCIPEGTPMALTWFLFIIEIVRNSIRPITLTVRLVANILAGHLLIILLSRLALRSFTFSFLYIALNSVELLVALIQSYIFMTMVTLYYSEVN